MIPQDGLVVVKFSANKRCKPCRDIAPVFKEVSEDKVFSEIKFLTFDLDENQDNMNLASKYQVKGIPTILLFKNGEVRDFIVGFQDKDKLEERIYLLME